MPIFYNCVVCRQEIYLADAKSGTLSSCPRCRLKFLAPAPNVAAIPPGWTPESSPPPPPSFQLPAAAQPKRPAPAPAQQQQPGSGSRPSFLAAPGRQTPAPQAAQRPAQPAAPRAQAPAQQQRPAQQGAAPAAAQRPSPPPSYPKDSSRPPIYPLDPRSSAPAPAPAKPEVVGTFAPVEEGGEGSGIFGLHSDEEPKTQLFDGHQLEDDEHKLFGGIVPDTFTSHYDTDEEHQHEPEAEDEPELELPTLTPTEDAPQAPDELVSSEDETVDEGGGISLPAEPEEPPVAAAQTTPRTPAAQPSAGAGDALITMDDLFMSGGKPAAPVPAPAPAPAAQGTKPPTGTKLPNVAQTAPAKPASGARIPAVSQQPGAALGGVAPPPFLKPVQPAQPAPAPAGAAPPAQAQPGQPTPKPRSGQPSPLVLTPVEGIGDAPFQLPGGDVYLLGRDRDAHVKILSTSVSRRHARIDATGAEHVLIDLGSANGTQVNGQSVARHPLREGDLIRLGKVVLRYAPAQT